MRAVDVHQHFLPEPFLAALARRTEPPRLDGRTLVLAGEPGGEIDFRAHDLDARLAQLDRDGIDVALVSLAWTMEVDVDPDLRELWHESILDVASHSGGRLVPLACGECREGFAGACVSAPALVGGLDPLLGELARTGGILFVHPGTPRPAPVWAPGWWPAVVDYTAQMQAAFAAWLARDAHRHPTVPVVFAILAGGAPVQLERMRSRGVELRTTLHPNVYLDASSYGRRALELCLSTYGVTQLLYGSDVPVIDSRRTLDAVRAFGDAVANVVLRENPSRLLG